MAVVPFPTIYPNKIFGRYSLKDVYETFEIDANPFIQKLGYSRSQWKEFETGTKCLSEEEMLKIENVLQDWVGDNFKW